MNSVEQLRKNLDDAKKNCPPVVLMAEMAQLTEELCRENGWGDPYSYNRMREILMANELGHTICSTYSGADAFFQGQNFEYKSTIQQQISATYNGISVQPSWKQQEEYLINKKIGPYSFHFFARFEGSKIQEIWKMSADKVLEIITPKLEKDYNRKKNGNQKDPRLSATITKKEIQLNAERLE